MPEKTKPQEKSIGYIVVAVLPYLTGRPLDEIANAFISTLRPSTVRVIKHNGAQKCDANTHRVTVYLDERGLIDKIEQECDVELPDGMDGHDLSCEVPGCRVEWADG